MKKFELRELVYVRLAETLVPKGFVLNKRSEAFSRKFEGGSHSVYVSIVGREPSFEFCLIVGIRLTAAEEVFHLFSGAAPRDQMLSDTVLTQWTFFGAKRQWYEAPTFEIAKAATVEVSAIIEDKVLSLLNTAVDAKSIFAKLLENPFFDSTLPPSGIMHRLILARMAEHPQFLEIVGQAEHESNRLIPQEREKVDRLISYLRNTKL